SLRLFFPSLLLFFPSLGGFSVVAALLSVGFFSLSVASAVLSVAWRLSVTWRAIRHFRSSSILHNHLYRHYVQIYM
ncbi:hypothetical protein ACIQ1D_17070, partial [Lysinibacillus xylanilyticus]|uniref:hypothetical protein n=1 Tax=Lysinibacillus xylanilyticus TaxID=582475 RepID=UPI003809FD32